MILFSCPGVWVVEQLGKNKEIDDRFLLIDKEKKKKMLSTTSYLQ